MNHFSHPQHKLSFVYSERLFKCDGCGQVGIGIRFNCSHCNFDLHTHCAAANPATAPLRHHFYPDCLFNFLACPPGDSRRYCDACGKDIVGFVYHCRKWGYDLHPCCAALPHEHHIDGGLRLRLHSRASAPCDWCSQMGKSWCYRSDCNKYNLHVACAMDLSMDSPHELLNGGGGSRRGGGSHSEGSRGGSGSRESDRGGGSRGRGGGGGRGGGRGDGGGGDGGSVGRGGNRSDGGRGGSGDRMAIVLENRIPRSRGGRGVGRDSGGGSRGNGRGHGNGDGRGRGSGDQDRKRGNHGDGSGGGRRGGGKRGDGGRGRGGHDGDQSNRGGGRGDGSVSGDGSHSSGSGGHGADRGSRGRGGGRGGRGVGSGRGDRGHGSGSHGGDRAEGGGGSSHDEGGGGRGSNGGVIRSVGNNHHGGKVKKLCKLAAVVGHFVIAAVLGDPSAMIVGVVSALLSQ